METAQLEARVEYLIGLMEQQQADWLTVQQAAKVAAVGRETIDAAVRSGELAASDVGTGKHRHYRISRAALAEWMNSKRVRTTGAVAVDAVKG